MEALTRLLDAHTIEAQGFRSCMNILDLGKRGNRHLLEQACQHLIETDPTRRVTYTAVKTRLSALRAEQDQRPSTTGIDPTASPLFGVPPAAEVAAGPARDTSRAHLAGAHAFSLNALTRPAPADHSQEGSQRA